MSWNYRILQFAEHRALHEVYYDKTGRPEAYTEKDVGFVESLDEDDGIVGGLEMALRDVRGLPVLDISVFDLPIEDRPVCERQERAA